MKFTSVILALSAVVAMVQAAPLPDIPHLPPVGEEFGIGDSILAGVHNKFISVLDGAENVVNSVAKRDLTKAIPTDTGATLNIAEAIAN